MARDMTVRELRTMLEDVPDEWPVMLMISPDHSESWDCLPASVARSHVDVSEGCEGVWLYNLEDDSENPPVDWEAEYGVTPRT